MNQDFRNAIQQSPPPFWTVNKTHLFIQLLSYAEAYRQFDALLEKLQVQDAQLLTIKQNLGQWVKNLAQQFRDAT